MFVCVSVCVFVRVCVVFLFAFWCFCCVCFCCVFSLVCVGLSFRVGAGCFVCLYCSRGCLDFCFYFDDLITIIEPVVSGRLSMTRRHLLIALVHACPGQLMKRWRVQ